MTLRLFYILCFFGLLFCPVAESAPEGATPQDALPEVLEISCGNGVGMTLRLIPEGEFEMGSVTAEAGRKIDELTHTVRISRPFYIGALEVTQEQYLAVMGENPSWFKGDGMPVEWVSWLDATDFCERLSTLSGKSVRLPTEAEWEYACRAGTTTAYAFGDFILPSQANFKAASTRTENDNGTYRRRTMRTGSFMPNIWGLYDMHGNVMEWCGDRYTMFRKDERHSQGQGNGNSPRVLRGGSWRSSAAECRSASRFREAPDEAYADIGFRVVVEAPEAASRED